MTVDPLSLLLLWAFANAGKKTRRTGERPPSDFDFPKPGAPGLQPASYSPAGATRAWISYAPLNAQVIARAQALLNDPTAPVETIEADPVKPSAVVRYLKTTQGGKVNVTAWRPKPGATVPLARAVMA